MNTINNRYRLALVTGALGVVYGDIGTSPLYALRECFSGSHGITPSHDNVMGVVSLIFWSLTLIVSVKYLGLVMRANNKGEGGILALLSLAVPDKDKNGNLHSRLLLLLGVFGAALLYGDGIITPSVTVLGAVEGLEFVTPIFRPYVVPIAITILIALFSFQRFGTGNVGKVFGPVMLVWFVTLAVLGVRGIWDAPQILFALSPHHAIFFLWHHGHTTFVVLGAVFLTVTGAEALYADMSHFGLQPIQRAWFTIVFPGLILNYLGEGALLLVHPEAAKNPFFLLAPNWALLPLVGLSTMAAVIASQALISGAYSLTMQAIQMGYLPRLHIRHTSHSERGQIYMPHVNTFLMLACIGLVLGFQSSSRLAGAYGIAVSLTMVITTVLFFAAARHLWKWSLLQAVVVCGLFMLLELAFTAANFMKLWQGGWFPLAVGLLIFTQMTTWKKGRHTLRAKLAESYLPFDQFVKELDNPKLLRVPGTAVFLSGNVNSTPLAMLHSLRHYKALHTQVIILTLVTKDVPFVDQEERLQVEALCPNFYRVCGYFGFMERPNVPQLLADCSSQKLILKPEEMSFFLSRETILPKQGTGMLRWRKWLFATMSRNAQSATTFYQLPPNRVVELGMQIEI